MYVYITCKKANTVAVAQEKKHLFSSLQVLILLFQFLCNLQQYCDSVYKHSIFITVS